MNYYLRDINSANSFFGQINFGNEEYYILLTLDIKDSEKSLSKDIRLFVQPHMV